MASLFQIIYHPEVLRKDLPKISAEIKQRIQKAVEGKLTLSPQEFGEPLRRTLRGYWKLRVGDYRVIYKIDGKNVMVLRMGHRREIYDRNL